MYPELANELGGMVIAYSPQSGGITLVDPDGDLSDEMFAHVLSGDLLQGQNIKTILRRRLPVWDAAATAFGKRGDYELSKLFAQGFNEIEMNGSITDTTYGRLWKSMRSRGLV